MFLLNLMLLILLKALAKMTQGYIDFFFSKAEKQFQKFLSHEIKIRDCSWEEYQGFRIVFQELYRISI